MTDSPLTQYVQSTSIYKRYAKGITAGVAALVNIGWLLTVLPAGLVSSNTALYVALAIQFLGGVVGVVTVPNSPTAKQVQQIEEYVGRHQRRE